MVELFRQEVPEIEQGLLRSSRARVTPVRGPRLPCCRTTSRWTRLARAWGAGSRVTSVTNELAGERGHCVVERRPAEFVIGALATGQLQSIVVDEEQSTMDVVVDEENLAMAIGRGGQNVRWPPNSRVGASTS